MINFDLTTLIVAIAVIAFFSNLGRKLIQWRESTFEKILIVVIMLLAGLISVVSVVDIWNSLVVPWLPSLRKSIKGLWGFLVQVLLPTNASVIPLARRTTSG